MPNSKFEKLINLNNKYIEEFQSSKLIETIQSPQMQDKKKRDKFLACVQVFSNSFQKMIMLRSAFTELTDFEKITYKHLKEEFGHNVILEEARQHQPPIWDPILESLSCWFSWRMFSLNDCEKLVLVHFILEAGSDVVCSAASEIFSACGEGGYFNLHSELDKDHKNMGLYLLKGLSDHEYDRLLKVQHQSWSIFNAAMMRMAEIIQAA